MTVEYIITLTAENRVGILAAVSNAMAELGAEMRECSQTIVQGYFTMIFAAEFPEDREEFVIRDHLVDVCRPFGIEVVLRRRSDESLRQPSVAEREPCRLRISGLNRAGTLRRIAGKISARQIDIIGMHARRDDESDRFEMVLKVHVPPRMDTEPFVSELRELDPELDLTVELDSV